MKIAVCVNDAQDFDYINQYIGSYCLLNSFQVTIDRYTDSKALLEAYNEHDYDTVFLNIEMEGMSGIELAKILRRKNRNCIIIFITSSPEYSLDAYTVGGAAYILKPLNGDQMKRALDKCKDKLVKSSRFIAVETDQHNKIRIPLASIIYVEVYNKDICFYLLNKKIETRKMPLKTVEELLNGEPFFRCHRSYIINMTYLDSINRKVAILDSGETIPVSSRRYKKFQEAFSSFITKSLCEELK